MGSMSATQRYFGVSRYDKMRAEENFMAKLSTEESTGYQPMRAARGTQISCKGWQQEAALRMLMNNLDPEVA